MLSVRSYLETALWSTEGENEGLFESQEYLDNLQKELYDFWEKTKHLYTNDEIETGHIEHDFYLTRNGHGAGFWDGDYEKGEELTKVAKSFGEDYGE